MLLGASTLNNSLSCSRIFSASCEADDTIRCHLETISRQIRARMDNRTLIAIMCAGSVSRGEPAVIRSDETKSVIVLSDYDILVVTRTRPSSEAKESLSRLARELTREFRDSGLLRSDVHIQVMSRRSFQMMPSTIRNTDIVRTGIVLYSSRNESIYPPALHISEIPKTDVLELLFNRIEEYLMARPCDGIPRFYGLSKLHSDLATAIRLTTGHLEKTYRDRLDSLALSTEVPIELSPVVSILIKHSGLTSRLRGSNMYSECELIDPGFRTVVDGIEADILPAAITLLHYHVLPVCTNDMAAQMTRGVMVETVENHAREYILARFSPHKCVYVLCRMLLDGGVAPKRALRLCTYPLHPKALLNISVAFRLAYLTSRDRYMIERSDDLLRLFTSTEILNEATYLRLLARYWESTNAYFVKP